MECRVLRDERLDVLYGEADAATRERALEHLASCETCREETASLVSLRRDLRSWMLPPMGAGATDRPFSRRWIRALPVAAAILLGLGGAALGLSGSEVRYEQGRLSFRLGRPAPDLRHALKELESRALAREQALRDEIQATIPAPFGGGPQDERALLTQVEQLIRDSEARQAQQIQTRLARLDQSTEAQRRYDLARVAASLAYLDGRNGQQVARTTELMGYMLEASHKR